MQPYWLILLPVALTYFCTHMLLTAQVNNTVTPHIKQNSPYIATMTENARKTDAQWGGVGFYT